MSSSTRISTWRTHHLTQVSVPWLSKVSKWSILPARLWNRWWRSLCTWSRWFPLLQSDGLITFVSTGIAENKTRDLLRISSQHTGRERGDCCSGKILGSTFDAWLAFPCGHFLCLHYLPQCYHAAINNKSIDESSLSDYWACRMKMNE